MAGVEFYSGILCAGFVNAHSHLELAYLRGAIEEGCGFIAFASSIGKVRGNFSEEEQLSAIAEADRTMWEEGVDAVGDIVNGATSFAVKATSKIYYHNFAEVFGLRECNLKRQQELLRYPNTTLTPHSTYSVQDESFMEVCCSSENKILSIHFLETEDERTLFYGNGELHDWYRKAHFDHSFIYYGSPAERIRECTTNDKRLLLVHNCAISKWDIELLTDYFKEPISCALCPRSNAYIMNEKPRCVELLRKAGSNINICIGTDSLASNWSLSMVEELKQFSGVPLAELLQWATINGAKALGIDDRFGTIEVGKQSGIVNLTGVNLDDFTLTPSSKAVRIL